MSSSLSRIISTFDLFDLHRAIYPQIKVYSHFYQTPSNGTGASRLDRAYGWGDITVEESMYCPAAFTDHMAYVISLKLPANCDRIFSPITRPIFTIRPEIIQDSEFQLWLADSMADWLHIKELGLGVLDWWEYVVKPGIRQLAIKRSKQRGSTVLLRRDIDEVKVNN